MAENQEDPRGAMTNAAWNAFATFFSMAITFVVAPVLIHKLGTAQWGLLILVWSVTGILGMANFGMGEATLRFIAHYRADQDMTGVNRVLGASLTFYVTVCSAVSVVLFAATPIVAGWIKVPEGGNEQVEWLLRLAALLFTLAMVTNAYRSIPMAMHRYDITSRVSLGQSVCRSVGMILVVLAGKGVVHVVLWEILVASVFLVAQIWIARRLLPALKVVPSMSFTGIREIFGYSVYSFLTHIFLMMYREAGKLILGFKSGTTSVAYLGTPDSVAYRIHMIVVSGVETLVPRFSASRDEKARKALLVTSTWAAVTCGVVFYIPLAVLMPDFLRLWINPEFSLKSAAVGQLLALSFIAAVAYTPIATLFRGIGRPGVVTLVMIGAGLTVLVFALLLVSSHGVLGVGYAYLLSGVAWLGGLVVGWLSLYGLRSIGLLLRVAGLPLLLGCGLGIGEVAVRSWWGLPGWLGLFVLGGSSAAVNAIVVFGVDRVIGGDSPARYALEQILKSDRIGAFRNWLGR